VTAPRPVDRTSAPASAHGRTDDETPTDRKPTELERLAGWVDSRTGVGEIVRNSLRKVFPDHWTFLLGEIALFCLVILVATGVFLTFFYTADSAPTTYSGPYTPLVGSSVSAAFASVMRLSFEVEAGLLMRQVHHWTALVFLGAIAAHLCRIFFTGAFRRPREINWLIGSGLLLLALGEGITGYSLPDDLLSGTGLRIIYSAIISIPLAGPWVAQLLFGGDFPTEHALSRLFVFHILLLPAILLAGAGLHILLVWIQQHTQYRGPRETEHNVVGLPFWPGQVFRSTGLFFMTAAAITLVAGFIQINPVWEYGPYIPYVGTVPAQPDWYVGWLEGALRIGPAIEPVIFGFTIPEPFLPAIVLPGLLFGAVILWPFIEARITGDHRTHNLLDDPVDAPIRTATGAAGIAIFLSLTLAGGDDVIGTMLNVPVESLIDAFRILVIAAPIVTWLVVYAICRERRAARGTQPPAIRLQRTADGGFEEIES
jgi:ubiquinol-cytochrome c reductase cytochrome b subunit